MMKKESGDSIASAFVGVIAGVIIGIHLASAGFVTHTVPFIKMYADARVIGIPVTLDSEGVPWLWNEDLKISTKISKEDLIKLVKEGQEYENVQHIEKCKPAL